jgi:hypothetical protein
LCWFHLLLFPPSAALPSAIFTFCCFYLLLFLTFVVFSFCCFHLQLFRPSDVSTVY